jgi:hypothetical protein
MDTHGQSTYLNVQRAAARNLEEVYRRLGI